MFSHILITCIGNICRSPMGEAFFRQRGLVQLTYPIEVRSAGTHALIGHPADTHAEKLMAELNLDISQHRGEILSSQLIHWADIILVMELEQKRYIESKYPTARGKVFRLLEDESRDIPDPYRQDIAAFKAAFTLIKKGTDEWIKKLS